MGLFIRPPACGFTAKPWHYRIISEADLFFITFLLAVFAFSGPIKTEDNN